MCNSFLSRLQLFAIARKGHVECSDFCDAAEIKLERGCSEQYNDGAWLEDTKLELQGPKLDRVQYPENA